MGLSAVKWRYVDLNELFELSQTCLNKLERVMLAILTLASHYYLKNWRKKITQACTLSLSPTLGMKRKKQYPHCHT